MGLKATHIVADDEGETHLVPVELPTVSDPSVNGLKHLTVPTTTMVYVEYPPEPSEMWPGFHSAPRRQLVLCLKGAFEVTTTSGQSQVFGPGDWFLADDLNSKGHTTKSLGTEPRINLAIGIASEWELSDG